MRKLGLQFVFIALLTGLGVIPAWANFQVGIYVDETLVAALAHVMDFQTITVNQTLVTENVVIENKRLKIAKAPGIGDVVFQSEVNSSVIVTDSSQVIFEDIIFQNPQGTALTVTSNSTVRLLQCAITAAPAYDGVVVGGASRLESDQSVVSGNAIGIRVDWAESVSINATRIVHNSLNGIKIVSPNVAFYLQNSLIAWNGALGDDGDRSKYGIYIASAISDATSAIAQNDFYDNGDGLEHVAYYNSVGSNRLSIGPNYWQGQSSQTLVENNCLGGQYEKIDIVSPNSMPSVLSGVALRYTRNGFSFDSFNRAQDTAAFGDTIRILHGPASTEKFVITKRITLESATPNMELLYGDGTSPVIWIQSAGVTLNNLTVSNQNGDGIWVQVGNPDPNGTVTIRNSKINLNSQKGLVVLDSEDELNLDLHIINTEFKSNADIALKLDDSYTELFVTGSSFETNVSDAIRIDQAAGINVSRSYFTSNSGVAINVSANALAELEPIVICDNDFYSNPIAVSLPTRLGQLGRNNWGVNTYGEALGFIQSNAQVADIKAAMEPIRDAQGNYLPVLKEFVSEADGPWSDPSTWSPAQVPSGNISLVTIKHNVTWTGNTLTNVPAAKTIGIEQGGALVVGHNSANSRIVVDEHIQVSGNLTLNPGATVSILNPTANYNWTGMPHGIMVITSGNLTLNGIAGRGVTINGVNEYVTVKVSGAISGSYFTLQRYKTLQLESFAQVGRISHASFRQLAPKAPGDYQDPVSIQCDTAAIFVDTHFDVLNEQNRYVNGMMDSPVMMINSHFPTPKPSNTDLNTNNMGTLWLDLTNGVPTNNAAQYGLDSGSAQTLAVHDLNQDGYPDLFVGANWGGQNPRSQLWLNNGGTGFSNITDIAGLNTIGTVQQAKFFDYDNDRKPDLLVLDGSMIKLFHNTTQSSGPITFVPVTLPDIPLDGSSFQNFYPARFVMWDIDNNDYLDIVVFGSTGAKILKNPGSGPMQGFDWQNLCLPADWRDPNTARAVSAAAIADYDHDGKAELLTYEQTFKNSGQNSNLTQPDRFLEVYRPYASPATEIIRQNIASWTQQLGDNSYVQSIVLGDFNGDSWVDAAYLTTGNNFRILINNRPGKLALQTGVTDFFAITVMKPNLKMINDTAGVAYDINSDGKDELLVLRETSHTMGAKTLDEIASIYQIVTENGKTNSVIQGVITSSALSGKLPLIPGLSKVALADVNGDASPDLVSVGRTGIGVFQGQPGAQNRWLKLNLVADGRNVGPAGNAMTYFNRGFHGVLFAIKGAAVNRLRVPQIDNGLIQNESAMYIPVPATGLTSINLSYPDGQLQSVTLPSIINPTAAVTVRESEAQSDFPVTITFTLPTQLNNAAYEISLDETTPLESGFYTRGAAAVQIMVPASTTQVLVKSLSTLPDGVTQVGVFRKVSVAAGNAQVSVVFPTIASTPVAAIRGTVTYNTAQTTAPGFFVQAVSGTVGLGDPMPDNTTIIMTKTNNLGKYTIPLAASGVYSVRIGMTQSSPLQSVTVQPNNFSLQAGNVATIDKLVPLIPDSSLDKNPVISYSNGLQSSSPLMVRGMFTAFGTITDRLLLRRVKAIIKNKATGSAWVTLGFYETGATGSNPAPMPDFSTVQGIFTINANDFDDGSYSVSVEAEDINGNRTSSNFENVQITSLSESDYRYSFVHKLELFAPAFRPGAGFPIGLEKTNVAQWENGSYNVGSSLSSWTMLLGKGYWIRNASSAPITLDFSAGTSLPSVQHPLNYQGWHIVGNPFYFTGTKTFNLNSILVSYGSETKSLAGAINAGWLADVGFKWVYGSGATMSSTGSYSAVPLSTGTLSNWQGIWIYTYVSPLSFQFSKEAVRNSSLPINAKSTLSEAIRAQSVSDQNWTLFINIKAEGRILDTDKMLGVRPKAVDGWQADDIPLPPHSPEIGDTAYGYFANADWGARAGVYALDFRKPFEDQKEWSYMVDATQFRGKNLTLELGNLEGLPDKFSVRLFDSRKKIWVDFSGRGNYTFDTPDAGFYDFKIKVMDQKLVAKAVDIEKVTVYPNPFNPSAGQRAKFEIVSNIFESHVATLKIYSLTGRLIASIEDGSRNGDEMDLPLEWDGRDMNGNLMANDMYFYLIKLQNAAGDSVVKKGKVVLWKK